MKRIKRLVLEKISLSASRSALLPTPSAPRILMDLLTSFCLSNEDSRTNSSNRVSRPAEGKKRKAGRTQLEKTIPIGLPSKSKFFLLEEEGWINSFNALMQFILFLPSLGNLFLFAPRSFHPFLEFIDRYKADQQANQAVSSANTASLIQCVRKKLPISLFMNQADLYAILQNLIQALFPSLPGFLTSKAKSYFPDSIAFHPEWHLAWDGKKEKILDEIIGTGTPQELLISVKRMEEPFCNSVKKQFFTASDGFYYDLDAFIEMRMDQGMANFVTYLKVDGNWYQCDDERIVRLRSNSLSVPLGRSVLLHYTRIEFDLTKNSTRKI